MVNTLDNLWKAGKDFLGSDYAIMGGAMSWISEHQLVSAISNAGAFGVLACGSMSPELLKNEVILTKELVQDKLFGVNIVTIHPDLHNLIDVCIENKVSHIILAGGIPKLDTINYVKKAGIKIMAFAPTISVARRLIKNGIDAIIIEGMEAGGHIGPVSTSVLAQEILPRMKMEGIPVFIAGGIGHGSLVINYLRMGASGCQMGTMFACAKESIAHDNFKRKFLSSTSRDTTVSIQLDENFPVIPVRAIRNKATEAFMKFQKEVIGEYNSRSLSKKEGQLKIERYWAGALKKAVIDGDIENGSLMAGQSVGMVDSQLSVSQIVNKLIRQANEELELLS